jgi:hypothetical protein
MAGPPSEILSRVVGDEALLLDTRTGNYFSLDPVGTDIWRLLGEGRTVDEIVSVIADRFGIDASRVRSDVLELLEELRDAGLWT